MSYVKPQGPLDFNVIGEAFTLLFKRWTDYLVMGFVSCLLPAIVSGGLMLVMFSTTAFIQPSSEPDFAMFGTMFLFYPAIFGAVYLSFPCYGGISVYTFKLVRTGDASLSDFWDEWNRAGKWYGLGFLMAMWYFLGILACGIGSWAVSALLFVAMPIMAHEDLSASDAIRESYERLKPYFWPALGLSIITQIIGQIGTAACYIGFFMTFPLYFIVPALVYARWIEPLQPPQSASPYPRAGAQGYGAPPTQQNIADEQHPPQAEERKPDDEQ